ncbi:acetylserotonin O-methyltransferase [Streptomyces sp. JJ36]|uniref:acetylserotonin O-methyltransferase n=1 Tax=Streptomyces sp. JJ36 TaxID=2736645 RepID=UPI001F34D298|nr:acetylserotonin O-methyltransferase [Streptomyces sp. JJ36]MCF6522822.1 hypothetical protein [Streptomyces sp. JJ36]
MTSPPPAGGRTSVDDTRMALVMGFALAQVTGTMARLGIPDRLASGPATAPELARDCGADASRLARLLRAAVALGLLTVSDGVHRLTPLGEEFRRGRPSRTIVELYGDPAVWEAFGGLEDAVRGGKPAFDRVHGTPFFLACEENTRLGDRFTAGMALSTSVMIPAIVHHCDVSGFRHVVDVGGGDGSLLAALLTAYPSLEGTLHERPTALRAAEHTLAAAGVTDRCTLLEGDFFASVPEGGDLYVLKNVLHDWDDEDCVRVLRHCAGAAEASRGSVMVPTLLMPTAEDIGAAEDALMVAMSDVEMMVLTPGRERTLAEHEDLFARSGLRLTSVVKLPGLAHHAVLFASPERGGSA